MIDAEYQRFLNSLDIEHLPSEVGKIANLIANNLDEIVPLGTHQGQRAKRVAALAQQNWEVLSCDIEPLQHRVVEGGTSIKHLSGLNVGPFRGFARQESFDFSSQLVLVYGPNGSGKSSFCEALEYALLGNVAEAANKRFGDQGQYLKNAHTDDFHNPELSAVGEDGDQFLVESNEAKYRFCFVEKNRVDDFSRIAAQMPAKQTELISTLFGLDAFNQFVRNFSQEIDPKYIDIVGVKNAELAQKRQTLSVHRNQIDTGRRTLEELGRAEASLVNQYQEGKTFRQMDAELHGEDGQTGSLVKIEGELQEPLKAKSHLTTAKLQHVSDSIEQQIKDLRLKRNELEAAGKQLSFKKMFEALAHLQQASADTCPACKTPLDRAVVNPFTHAAEELEKLQHLSELEESQRRSESQLGQSLQSVSQMINICCERYPENNVVRQFRLELNNLADIDWWERLAHPNEVGDTPLDHLNAQVRQLEVEDAEIEIAIQTRSAKQSRLNTLREFSRQVTVLRTRRDTALQTISAAQQAVNDFDRENEQLIADAHLEIPVVEKNQEIVNAYSRFVAFLNAYKNRLPGRLVADLGDTVVELYNAFNRNDVASELLARVKLPLLQNQRFELSFQNDPETFFDALHILSEGHIRCLGLAVLLAKNLREECPILIFDDPVNAIDDDHRDSIRRTLFEDDYFRGKQIILTCHGEEFFKDIQNLLPADLAAKHNYLAFLPRIGEPHIRVDFNCAPRNYIISARAHFNQNEIREALSKSRQALESLMKKKLWRYVHRHGDGNLSLKLRSATAPIELRNLAEKLRQQISKADFRDENRDMVLDPLNSLLGPNGDSREWRYLNKGTHEEDDRAEFNRAAVDQIIRQIEEIDRVCRS